MIDGICDYVEDVKRRLEQKDQQIGELKKQLEEKDRNCLALFSALYSVLEKQDPENVSTRIDFLTKQDNSKINDIYKEWRVLKQQLADAEEHIDSLELQLRRQYQLVDKLVKENNKLKNQNHKHKGEK